MDYIIAVPLDKNLAEFIGKKGSENSLTYYNRKVGDNIIVVLTPSSLDEKFYAVAESMLIADEIVLSTSSIDKAFGEMLVACSLLGKHVIFTSDNPVEQLLKSIKVEDFEICDRENLLERIMAYKKSPEAREVRVDVDKSFPVKGIGSVALGIVTRGTVKVHDQLQHSSGKGVEVRSIQSQDVDVKEAGHGTRVGLALKGIEHSEIEKGDLLTKSKVEKSSSIKVKLQVNSFSPEEIGSSSYMLVSNFSYVRATSEGKDAETTLKLEKAIAVEKGDKFLLIREKAPRIFASGEVL